MARQPPSSREEGRKRRLANLTPWKKGQSGNPTGRPVSEFRATCRRITEETVPLIEAIIRSKTSKAADRINAWKALADRGHGSVQPVDASANAVQPPVVRIEIVPTAVGGDKEPAS